MTEFRDKRLNLRKKMSNKLHVTLLVIGDEILYGRTTDLNGAWLSKFLFKNGLYFKNMIFVRDQESDIKEALKNALLQSDIVITSGGIGPTLDDKTKKILAEYFDKKIIERDNVASIVDENYRRFGREWIRSLNYYHYFPEDFIAINNPKGLAPGLGFYKNQKLVLAGPGVPREFQAMNEWEFLPIIKKYFQDKFQENQQVVVRTRSIPEEKILWMELSNFGSVSSLPHTIGIDIVVSFTGTTEDQIVILEKIKQIISTTPLEEYVWQYGNDPLPISILNLAKEKQLTFAFAESCTGGLCSSKITDLSGSSEVFYGSVISYDNSVKINELNVLVSTLDKFGAVSLECAKEMALGVKNKIKVDIGISITGIAGPTGGSSEKPIGTVVIGICYGDTLESYRYQFPGDRIRLKERFSDMALYHLLCAIKKY
jgi:nicotinamide-nucleotide amidase